MLFRPLSCLWAAVCVVRFVVAASSSDDLAISLYKPVGGEVFRSGDPIPIEWANDKESHTVVEAIEIKLSKDSLSKAVGNPYSGTNGFRMSIGEIRPALTNGHFIWRIDDYERQEEGFFNGTDFSILLTVVYLDGKGVFQVQSGRFSIFDDNRSNSSKTTGTLSISSSSATPTTTAYGIRTGVSRWLLRPPPGLYPSDNPSAEPTTSTSSATSSSNPSTTLLTITSPHPSAGLYPIESASGNEWGMVVPVSPDAPDNGWIPAGDAKPPTPNSLSTITKIGIGAGVLFGFLTALFFAVPFYRDKRAKGRIPKVKVVSSDDSLPIGNAGAAGIELPERAHLRELQAHDTARVAGVL